MKIRNGVVAEEVERGAQIWGHSEGEEDLPDHVAQWAERRSPSLSLIARFFRKKRFFTGFRTLKFTHTCPLSKTLHCPYIVSTLYSVNRQDLPSLPYTQTTQFHMLWR